MNPERLAALWEEHRPVTDERVDLLAAAVEALADDALDDDLRDQAQTAAHRLAGSLGMFGYRRAGELAAAFETRLRAPEPLDGAAATLARIVADLRTELGSASAPPPDPVSDAGPSAFSLVLVVLPDDRAVQRVHREAGRRGVRVVATADVDEVAAIVARQRPEAVVLDLDCPGDGLAAVRDLRRDTPEIPVLVIGDGDAVDVRLEATRAGAVTFLERSVTPAGVVDQVALVLEPANALAVRGLVVSARAAVVDPSRTALTAAGLAVVATADRTGLWDELRRVNPSLVVVDGDLEGSDGPEVVRMLRADRRWRQVPVLMVATDDERACVERAFAAGADDVLVAPLDPERLAPRLRGHVERARLQQGIAGMDVLTGLTNRSASAAAFGRLLRLAERMDKPLCLAVIELDPVVAGHGPLAADVVLRRLGERLQQRFRGEDVIARWGGGRFVVGLLGMERTLGIERLQHLLAAFSDEPFRSDDGTTFTAAFSAGVAQYPVDGTDLEELHVATDAALETAREDGRNAVIGAGHWRRGTQQVEVAVVEDDEVTAAAIAAGLGELGHRCWRFSNGAGAVEALAGSPPHVRARLILLDLDLPAVDGFELLTFLGREGVLQSTTVIVLSATDDAQTMARTRALGATDHLAKPVSVEVLAERVERVLGRAVSAAH